MKIIRSLLACAVVVGMFAAPLSLDAAAIPRPASAHTGEAEIPALVLDVVPEASGVIVPDQDLALTVTLENRTAATIAEGTANVYLGQGVIADRGTLADWLAGGTTGDRLRGDLVAQVPSPSLFPGQSLVLPQVVIPAAAITLGDATSFGARRLSVTQEVAGFPTAESRSSITVNPGTGVPTNTVALAMPIAIPAITTGLVPADLLETYTAETGLLTRQLDQASGRSIALGIDPRLIVSIRALGTSAPESARLWLARLEALPNETFPLAYADADLAAASQAGAGVPLPTPFPLDAQLFPVAQDPATPAPSASGLPEASPTPPESPAAASAPTLDSLLAFDYSTTGLAWVEDLIASDLETFRASGLETTLVSSDNVSTEAAGGGAAVLADGYPLLRSDAALAAQFRAAVDAVTPAGWQSAMATLAATLATAALEDAGSNHTMLATLGRDDALGGFRLSQTLDAVEALPWFTPALLSTALGQTSVAGAVIDTPVAEGRVTRVRELFASEATVGQFSSALVDPTALTGERRIALLSLISRDWAPDDPDWEGAVSDYLVRSGEIVSSVNVETGTITQWSDNGPLPITISNTLNFPVTVFVTVQPRSAILDVRESLVEVTIEANSQNRASVPVQSVANGQVVIAITLTSATGAPISQPAFAEITVQAGWETAAIAVLGALLVGVFILGIVRTVRRGRQAGPADDTAADDD